MFKQVGVHLDPISVDGVAFFKNNLNFEFIYYMRSGSAIGQTKTFGDVPRYGGTSVPWYNVHLYQEL